MSVRPEHERNEEISTQIIRRRLTWLLIPPIHATAFAIQWLIWQVLLVEPHPLSTPIGYIAGYTVALAALASFVPVVCTMILSLIGFAPRAWVAALLGAASGTLSHALFRSWLPLKLPDGDVMTLLFIQNGLAWVFVVSFQVAREVLKNNRRAA